MSEHSGNSCCAVQTKDAQRQRNRHHPHLAPVVQAQRRRGLRQGAGHLEGGAAVLAGVAAQDGVHLLQLFWVFGQSKECFDFSEGAPQLAGGMPCPNEPHAASCKAASCAKVQRQPPPLVVACLPVLGGCQRFTGAVAHRLRAGREGRARGAAQVMLSVLHPPPAVAPSPLQVRPALRTHRCMHPLHGAAQPAATPHPPRRAAPPEAQKPQPTQHNPAPLASSSLSVLRKKAANESPASGSCASASAARWPSRLYRPRGTEHT